MFKNDYIVLFWFVALGVIAFMCLEQGALWGSIIAGSGTVITFFVISGKWICRRIKLQKLYDVYFMVRGNKKQNFYTTIASHSEQEIRIVLQMKTNIFARRIHLNFEEIQGKPDIIKLNHWHMPPSYSDPNIEIVEMPDGSWSWRYFDALSRRKGDNIRIGVRFLAKKEYNGSLEVFLDSDSAEKHKNLPFKVKRGWDDGALRTDSQGNIVFPKE